MHCVRARARSLQVFAARKEDTGALFALKFTELTRHGKRADAAAVSESHDIVEIAGGRFHQRNPRAAEILGVGRDGRRHERPEHGEGPAEEAQKWLPVSMCYYFHLEDEGPAGGRGAIARAGG